jgi:hypothetical protein
VTVITRNARQSRHSQQAPSTYAAFFCCAFTLAHLARCAAAIFLRADASVSVFCPILEEAIQLSQPRVVVNCFVSVERFFQVKKA